MAQQDDFSLAPNQLPLEYQAQQDQVRQRKMLAQALLANGKSAPQMVSGRHVRKSPIEHLVRGLSTYLGTKEAGNAEEAGLEMAQRAQAAQAGDMQAVIAAQGPQTRQVRNPEEILDKDFSQDDESIPTSPVTTPGDTRAAIARAMASPWGNVKSYGLQLQKDEAAKQNGLVSGLAGNNPQASLDIARGGLNTPVQLNQPQGPTAGALGDSQYVVTRGKDGEYKIQFAPKASVTNINTGAGAGAKEFWKDAGATIVPGKGDSWKAGQSAKEMIQVSSDALRALESGANAGTGAAGLQFVRGVGEQLGIKDAATMPTAELSAKLKQRVLSGLGGLGAQVSDADRVFYTEASGDIASNPAALRKILLDTLKYGMQSVQNHNKTAAGVAGGLQDPQIAEISNILFKTGDLGQGNADLLQQMLEGKTLPLTAYGATPPRPTAPGQLPLPPGVKRK